MCFIGLSDLCLHHLTLNNRGGIMKKIIFTTFCCIIFFVSLAFASSFCDGWAAGYKAGYCYQKYGCISPMIPICPIPNVGENTYQDGYNRGFATGMKAR